MNPSLPVAVDRRLSVALLVRDEAEVLAETLRSLDGIADEIVVADTGSRDGSCRLAEQHGARVVRIPWSDDFAAARNRLLAECQGDWILWLNAGERLQGEAAVAVRRFVDCEAQADHAYALMVQLPAAEPSGTPEEAAQPRLLPKRADLWFEGRVRETVLPSLAAAGLLLDLAPATVLRHPREHDAQRKAAKAQRNLALANLEKQATPAPSARVLLALGEAYADLNQPEAAREAFVEAKATAVRGSTEMLDAYYGLLTTFDGAAGLAEQQLAVCLEALEVYPLDAQLLLAMGSYLQNRQQLALAARSFRMAMEHGQVNLETWHLSEIDEMASICLGLTLQLLGQDEEARQAFVEGLQQHPRSQRLHRHLINLHIRHGRQTDALALVEQMPVELALREPLRQVVLGAFRARGQEWTAALAYLQGAYLAGCADPLCLRWLAVTLLSNGQVDAAVPVLRHWQQVEPANAELASYLKAVAERPTLRFPTGEPGTARQFRFDTTPKPVEPAASKGQPQSANPRGVRRS